MTFVTSLYSLVVTLGLRWAQIRALEGPIFRSVSSLGGAETWHCKRGGDLKRLYLRPRYTYGGTR